MFDIQRTMREAYDKACRLLHESSSKSPTCEVDAVSSAVSMTTTLNNSGHRDNCPSTCTCLLVGGPSLVGT